MVSGPMADVTLERGFVADADPIPRTGPLLRETLAGLATAYAPTGMARLVLDATELGAKEPILPLALSVPQIKPEPGER